MGNKILSDNLFPVVGIGASAGGLAAFRRFVKAIPQSSGMAYVLVQHLDPDYESNLPGILQKETIVPVLVITDEIKVEPDHIYIIPSNKMLVANDGVLKLSPRPKKIRGQLNLPIDLFFTSLAEIHRAAAIGIVLSGKASDGTAGLRAIKDHGGITFAQDEGSAEYNEMPQAAIRAEVVDYIMSPEEIPGKLIQLKDHFILNAHTEIQKFGAEDELAYEHILNLLAGRKKTDFTYYKQNTVHRRIARRMAVTEKATPEDYYRYLQDSIPEQDALYQDLLIPVTSFFRDTKVFDSLCKSTFPQIQADKKPGEMFRIWVAACSTGQEVYSIAMCINEVIGNSDCTVQIFATDISAPAITKARAGLYTKSEVAEISGKRLKEFFTKTDEGYQIKKVIRDMCIFAGHNFLTDPPFSRIDFVSCRNVLIYLEPYLQKRALAAFHYSLNPKGLLLLGKSETTGSMSDLFSVVSKSDKLFSRKEGASKFKYANDSRGESKQLNRTNSIANHPKMPTDFRQAADELILNNYTPVGVVVNAQLDIVHFRGNTSQYLQQADGEPTRNLLKLANSGLSFELRSLILKAKKEGKSVVKEGISMAGDGRDATVTIKVAPLTDIDEPHYLILFEKMMPVSIPYLLGNGKSLKSIDLLNQQLKRELAQNREDMSVVIEEQDAANQELQSVNEELLSGSEEMQSLNEELETSKEELQSTNEELTIINQELLSLNEQVSAAKTYAEAIVATTHQPLLVLDKNLRVKTANKAFYKTFQVDELETESVLVYDLGNGQWDIPQLRTLLEEILPEKSEFEGFEVTHNFTTIGLRIILLSGVEILRERVDEKLILLAIEDITDRRHAEELLKLSEAKFSQMADTMPQKVWTADVKGVVNYFNKCWLDYTGLSFEQLKTLGWKEIIHADDFEETHKCWEQSLKTGENFEMEHRFLKSDGTYRWHLSRGLVQKESSGAFRLWINTSTEIQKQKVQRQELELAVAARTAELKVAAEVLLTKNEELLQMNKELEAFAYVSSHDLQEPLRKIETFSKLIVDRELEAMSDTAKDYFRRIQRAAGTMRTLIRDLLAYSHTTTADRTFEMLSLNSIVAEVLDELKEPIHDAGVIVKTGKLCDASINEFQFRQVLQNLISNSLKFSKPGIKLRISITSRIKKGLKFNEQNPGLSPAQLSPEIAYCNITFKDNGLGFEPRYNHLIFELFERLNSKDAFEGTGIGLSIVKKIIDHHGGAITALGEEGVGATFNIYIPVRIANA